MTIYTDSQTARNNSIAVGKSCRERVTFVNVARWRC